MAEHPSSQRPELTLALARLTPARVALGRSGASLPTAAALSFGLDHARARDAVHAPFDAAALSDEIARSGVCVLRVRSQAEGRANYLRRPDLGRRLDGASRDLLRMDAASPSDLVVVLGDGLSPGAVVGQAPALVAALMAKLSELRFGPVVIATGARVALGDDIGAILRTRLIIMLIGERPGLSTPESLGAYVTFAPRSGLSDADRNCVSNIHAIGLSPDAAANRIAWLVRAALSRGITGISLKDDSAFAALPRPSL